MDTLVIGAVDVFSYPLLQCEELQPINSSVTDFLIACKRSYEIFSWLFLAQVVQRKGYHHAIKKMIVTVSSELFVTRLRVTQNLSCHHHLLLDHL